MSRTRSTIYGLPNLALGLALGLMLVAQPVLGASKDKVHLPQFRLYLDSNARQAMQLEHYSEQHSDILQPHLHSLEPVGNGAGTGQYLEQYDAQLFYPVNTFHGMSLDLGLNIKYLSSGNRYSQPGRLDTSSNFSQAIPMFYATALFDLPFDGMSASLEGSHLDSAQTRAFDYRAKLQYRWNSGLGLEGGWQHQQYSLDYGQPYPGLEYESKGLYLDLFMDF
ncbi:MAG: hypothetical protein PVH51_01210 [Thiohalophilus sp.]